MPFVVNLGGEGEEPGALNQQDGVCVGPHWRVARTGETFAEAVRRGPPFLICPNDALALPDGCADAVVSNHVPVGGGTGLGRAGIVPAEVARILRPGGTWTHDGVPRFRKP